MTDQDLHRSPWAELRARRSQLLAALAYVAFFFGGLYVFSAIGEDSGDAWDTIERSTNALVGVVLLAAGMPFAVAALVTRRADRREQPPGAQRQPWRTPAGSSSRWSCRRRSWQ